MRSALSGFTTTSGGAQEAEAIEDETASAEASEEVSGGRPNWVQRGAQKGRVKMTFRMSHRKNEKKFSFAVFLFKSASFSFL
jgi:hypothetical protein